MLQTVPCNHTVIAGIWARGRQRSRVKTRKRIETTVQRKIGVWSVEARVIKYVERLRLQIQHEPLGQLEVFKDCKIEAGLKGRTEEVAAVRTKAGLLSITGRSSRRGRPAGRDSTLTWVEEWNHEIVWIDVRNFHARQRARCEVVVRPTLRRLFWRNARSQRQNRIGDEIIGAEENACRRSGKVDHAEWLTAFRNGYALHAPAIECRIYKLRGLLEAWKHIDVINGHHMRTIKI